MSYLHREGKNYIIFSLSGIILFLGFYCFANKTWLLFPAALFIFLFIFSLQFFRYPKRENPDVDVLDILSPADGKVVVNEKLSDGRIQLSIFMSPLNVHANWVPLNGKIVRSEYFEGKYLVAWHPKSSTENERHEVDLQLNNNQIITIKQIAGAVARRVICYLKNDQEVRRGDELGFIKFGSRVDLLLPYNSEILIQVGDKTVGNRTVLAKIK